MKVTKKGRNTERNDVVESEGIQMTDRSREMRNERQINKQKDRKG